MEKVIVKVILEEGVQKPVYMTEGSAGMDVRANIKEPIVLGSLERVLVPTGIKMEIPQGYEVQVRPRSGLALKHGISIVNAPGTVDSDYRGDVGVILINLSKEDFVINPGERIAQLVLGKIYQMDLVEGELSQTERGEGGYGHTGVK